MQRVTSIHRRHSISGALSGGTELMRELSNLKRFQESPRRAATTLFVPSGRHSAYSWKSEVESSGDFVSSSSEVRRSSSETPSISGSEVDSSDVYTRETTVDSIPSPVADKMDASPRTPQGVCLVKPSGTPKEIPISLGYFNSIESDPSVLPPFPYCPAHHYDYYNGLRPVHYHYLGSPDEVHYEYVRDGYYTPQHAGYTPISIGGTSYYPQPPPTPYITEQSSFSFLHCGGMAHSRFPSYATASSDFAYSPSPTQAEFLPVGGAGPQPYNLSILQTHSQGQGSLDGPLPSGFAMPHHCPYPGSPGPIMDRSPPFHGDSDFSSPKVNMGLGFVPYPATQSMPPPPRGVHYKRSPQESVPLMSGKDRTMKILDQQGVMHRTGITKFFDVTKGFGFILDDQIEDLGGRDVFVHYTAILMKQGFRCLNPLEAVEYDLVRASGGGFQALNVSGFNGCPLKGATEEMGLLPKAKERERDGGIVKCSENDVLIRTPGLRRRALNKTPGAFHDSGLLDEGEEEDGREVWK